MKKTINFSRNVGMMLLSGIPLNHCLRTAVDGMKDERFKKIIEEMILHIETGGELSSGLKKHSKEFPPIFIGILRGGEVTGTLGESFLKGSKTLEKDLETKKNFKKAMLYPKIVAAVAVSVMAVLLVWVLPMFVSLVDNELEKLPIFTKFMLAISNKIKKDWFLISGSAALLLGMNFILIKNKRIKEKRDFYLLKLPVIGTLEKIKFVIRFGQLLSMLLESGVVLSEGIGIIVQEEQNSEISRRIMKVRRGLEKGRELSILLQKSRLFSEMDINLIRIGEESGQVAKVLEKIAEIKSRELEEKIKVLLILVEPGIILIMGIILGAIVAGVYLPILDMIDKNL